MVIRVEVKCDILGDDIFWEGDAENIDEIRNIPARRLAYLVAEDGEPRSIGMWHVSEVK